MWLLSPHPPLLHSIETPEGLQKSNIFSTVLITLAGLSFPQLPFPMPVLAPYLQCKMWVFPKGLIILTAWLFWMRIKSGTPVPAFSPKTLAHMSRDLLNVSPQISVSPSTKHGTPNSFPTQNQTKGHHDLPTMSWPSKLEISELSDGCLHLTLSPSQLLKSRRFAMPLKSDLPSFHIPRTSSLAHTTQSSPYPKHQHLAQCDLSNHLPSVGVPILSFLH